MQGGGHTSLERDNIVSSFNDEKSTLQILVTSLRVGATSYNLQKSCNHLICLDVPPAANVALQAIGLRPNSTSTPCALYLLDLKGYQELPRERQTDESLYGFAQHNVRDQICRLLIYI